MLRWKKKWISRRSLFVTTNKTTKHSKFFVICHNFHEYLKEKKSKIQDKKSQKKQKKEITTQTSLPLSVLLASAVIGTQIWNSQQVLQIIKGLKNKRLIFTMFPIRSQQTQINKNTQEAMKLRVCEYVTYEKKKEMYLFLFSFGVKLIINQKKFISNKKNLQISDKKNRNRFLESFCRFFFRCKERE